MTKPIKHNYIYLQSLEVAGWDERTWCAERIDRTDVEYIRSDLYKGLLRRYKALKTKFKDTVKGAT